MASLDLNNSELIKVRSSWADVMASSHYGEDDFVNKAFSSLLHNNADLKPLFADSAVLDKQKYYFKELLKFTMAYLHDEMVLNECTNMFVTENPSVVKYGVSYLEPMGSEVISTLRTSLGRDKFHAGLETLWIKVYVYIANCILLHDASDVSSVISNTNQSTSEEEILPLKLNKSPAPLSPETPQRDISGNTIKIDLGGNEKYRGFRRSVTESPKAPVLVKVPESFIPSQGVRTLVEATNRSSSASPQSSEAPLLFDPRPLRRRPSMEEPVLTPRSSRRNFSVQLQELGLDLEVRDSTLVHSFDPRRKASHKRTSSDLSLTKKVCERLLSTSSNESQVSDVDDDYKLEDDINFNQPSKQRSPVFDHNSFGIKGLAPIVESEHDDETSQYSAGSSNYAANSEKDSEEDNSSRTSSLSLHNLDYKSSISSGSAHSPVMDKGHKSTQSDISFMAPLSMEKINQADSYQNNPYQNRVFSSSVPSLTSRMSNGQRASLGFMRSSFILKKEMQEMGYNNPENVFVKPQMPAATQSMVNVGAHHSHHSLASLVSLGSRSSTQKRRELSPLPVMSRMEKESTPTPSQASTTSSKGKKSNFREKLYSLFGSSSSASSVSTRNISAPISVTKPPIPAVYETLTESRPPFNEHPRQIASRSSSNLRNNVVTSNHTRNSSRVSSLDLRVSSVKSQQSEYAGSLMLKKTSDTASILSLSSSKSRFSFFKSSTQNVKYPDGQVKRKNKYYVLKVPYKTIYARDLIRS